MSGRREHRFEAVALEKRPVELKFFQCARVENLAGTEKDTSVWLVFVVGNPRVTACWDRCKTQALRYLYHYMSQEDSRCKDGVIRRYEDLTDERQFGEEDLPSNWYDTWDIRTVPQEWKPHFCQSDPDKNLALFDLVRHSIKTRAFSDGQMERLVGLLRPWS